MMGCLVTSFGLCAFGFGLWTHDWKVLLGSVVLLFVWLLISDEILHGAEKQRERDLLERLWDDDDLAGSA